MNILVFQNVKVHYLLTYLNFKKMVHLNCSFLMRLRNKEFPQAFKEICSIYEEEQIEELHVKESLSRLKAHLDELKFVWEMRNPHPLTEVLLEQNKLRKEYLVGFRNRIRAIIKSPIAEEKTAAKTLFFWINKHRKDIYSLSGIIQNELVDNLQTELGANEKIVLALSTLELTNVFDSILSLTNQIKAYVAKRHDDDQKNLIKTTRIRREAYAELVQFLKSLQTGVHLEDPEVGFYADFERKIDSRVDKYRARLLNRSTRKTNSENEKSESDVVIDANNESNVVTLPEVTQMNSNGFNDGFDQSFDQKKTVASSSKLSQPSIENNEAIDRYTLLI